VAAVSHLQSAVSICAKKKNEERRTKNEEGKRTKEDEGRREEEIRKQK
jgi:hypothetical protein